MEREAGEVDPPTERDRKCADETGDPVAPDLGVGEDLKIRQGKIVVLFVVLSMTFYMEKYI